MSSKRIALIKDGIVENITIASDDPEESWALPAGYLAVEDDGTAQIGGSYVDGAFGPRPPE